MKKAIWIAGMAAAMFFGSPMTLSAQVTDTTTTGDPSKQGGDKTTMPQQGGNQEDKTKQGDQNKQYDQTRQEDKSKQGKQTSQTGNWEKVQSGTWMGHDNTSYRLNTNDFTLSSSVDGNTFSPVDDGVWHDMDGNWFRIKDKKLMMSDDEGKTWKDVKEGKWRGADGNWYKFDKNWSLMMMKDKKTKEPYKQE
ncbi:MAG: hypothetical protein AB1458_11755 [Bacteroidota bacterium]